MPYLLKMERPYAALIVDDSTLVRKVLSEQLILEGVFKIAEADNGEPALEILQSSARPDIIFCDLQMPGMDGLEFLRHLTALDYDGALVLMSGEDERILASVKTLGKAQNLNILVSLEKPITREKLASALDLFDKSAEEM
jgi:CheY-like chemotaxis protein